MEQIWKQETETSAIKKLTLYSIHERREEIWNMKKKTLNYVQCWNVLGTIEKEDEGAEKWVMRCSIIQLREADLGPGLTL